MQVSNIVSFISIFLTFLNLIFVFSSKTITNHRIALIKLLHIVMLLLSITSYYFPNFLIILVITTCSYTILFLQEYYYVSTTYTHILPPTKKETQLIERNTEHRDDPILDDLKEIIINANKQTPVRRFVKMQSRICGYDDNQPLPYAHL